MNLPLISANMDTITEDKMAITLAIAGGIGIIHRFCSIDEQVNMVKNVKRFVNYSVLEKNLKLSLNYKKERVLLISIFY